MPRRKVPSISQPALPHSVR